MLLKVENVHFSVESFADSLSSYLSSSLEPNKSDKALDTKMTCYFYVTWLGDFVGLGQEKSGHTW